jgi:hypothetical protein
MLHRVICYKLIDVSEVLTASIIRTMRASTSENSVSFFHTTRRNIPEYSRFHIHRHENLKSQRFRLSSTSLSNWMLSPG